MAGSCDYLVSDMKDELIVESATIIIPEKWEWSVFGGDSSHSLLLVRTPFDVPLWRRILTRIFLGSKWVRVK